MQLLSVSVVLRPVHGGLGQQQLQKVQGVGALDASWCWLATLDELQQIPPYLCVCKH
jgi:hypothetical protein